MQWLIDIIKELIHGQLGYFYRGDNVPHDFSVGDLTLDGGWHDLDLSAIIPLEVKAINLKVVVRTGVVPSQFDVRLKGQVNVINTLSIWTQINAFRLGGVFPVSMDNSRTLEYRGAAIPWTLLNLNVNGWWLR